MPALRINMYLWDTKQTKILIRHDRRSPWRRSVIMLFLLGIAQFAHAQDEPDTTTTIYDKIEEFTSKSKVGRWIHSTIFVPPEPEKPPPAPDLPSRRVNPYDQYRDRVIRKISIGRTDLPGGDLETLLASIREQLLPLGDDVKVYCGHGPDTTIGAEKRSNPFLH